MDSWQWPEAEKMAACDLVVDNNQTMEELEMQSAPLAAVVQERAARRHQARQNLVQAELERWHHHLTEDTAEDTEANVSCETCSLV